MAEVKDVLLKAVPILASTDIARTIDFYRSLGFKGHYFEDFSYGMAGWGEVELHFWKCEDKRIAESTSCYIRVSDINVLREALVQVLPELPEVKRTAWGTAELYILDPDGNLLKFGESLDDEEHHD
ncbi:bleomycin resistance protein [Pseudomonas sp. RHF3.3-3]|uniref:Glyoxalase-like domain n=1 Tax=Pseudomonas asplenii TaxID=53407 RepID=A0A0M9GG08_9PSED|nr:VOC family protein [Pseudomonas fuscovaginae]KPA90334.1 Glyoxalase-like domain [Pseudomonas fuscovaginae]